MNLRHFFIGAAIYGFLNAFSALAIPALALEMTGMSSDPATVLAFRWFGATVLGASVIVWLAKDTDDVTTRRALTVGLFVLFGIAFILSVLGVFTAVTNAVGWFFVAADFVLALGFGYFIFIR